MSSQSNGNAADVAKLIRLHEREVEKEKQAADTPVSRPKPTATRQAQQHPAPPAGRGRGGQAGRGVVSHPVGVTATNVNRGAHTPVRGGAVAGRGAPSNRGGAQPAAAGRGAVKPVAVTQAPNSPPTTHAQHTPTPQRQSSQPSPRNEQGITSPPQVHRSESEVEARHPLSKIGPRPSVRPPGRRPSRMVAVQAHDSVMSPLTHSESVGQENHQRQEQVTSPTGNVESATVVVHPSVGSSPPSSNDIERHSPVSSGQHKPQNSERTQAPSALVQPVTHSPVPSGRHKPQSFERTQAPSVVIRPSPHSSVSSGQQKPQSSDSAQAPSVLVQPATHSPVSSGQQKTQSSESAQAPSVLVQPAAVASEPYARTVESPSEEQQPESPTNTACSYNEDLIDSGVEVPSPTMPKCPPPQHPPAIIDSGVEVPSPTMPKCPPPQHPPASLPVATLMNSMSVIQDTAQEQPQEQINEVESKQTISSEPTNTTQHDLVMGFQHPSSMSQEQLMSTAQALMSELAMDIGSPQPSVSVDDTTVKHVKPSLTVSIESIGASIPHPESPSLIMSDLDREISQLRRSNETATKQLQLFSNPEETLQGMTRNICAFCKHRVLVGPYYDVGGGKRVHVDCFRCSNCKKPLTQFQCIDDTYLCPHCAHDLRPPATCVACGKVVSSDEAVVALNSEWHRSCFQCDRCGRILKKEFVEFNGKPYCHPRDSPCYRIAQGKVCCVCSGVLDVSYLTVFEKFYHRTCFCCSGCGVPFPSLEFFQINNQPYCETCATQILGDQLESDNVSATVTVP